MGHLEPGRAPGRPSKVALTVAGVVALALLGGESFAEPTPVASDLIAKPVWEPVGPPPGMRFYPPAPKERGIQGRAVVECKAAADGALTACAVVEEKPKGMGFGDATIRYVSYLRLKAADADGQPTAGRHVRVPMRWDLDVH